MDVVYWHFSKDPTGTTALALSVGLAFLTGFYLLFTGRRLPPAARGQTRRARSPRAPASSASSARTAGGRCSPALAAATAALGAAVGWWLFLIGMLFVVILAAIGFVFEYYRGHYAH